VFFREVVLHFMGWKDEEQEKDRLKKLYCAACKRMKKDDDCASCKSKIE
jgi:hypothetical protein